MESKHIPAKRSRTPRIALAIMAPVARLAKDETIAVACAAATVGTDVTVVPLAVMVVGGGVFVVISVFVCMSMAVDVVVWEIVCVAVVVDMKQTSATRYALDIRIDKAASKKSHPVPIRKEALVAVRPVLSVTTSVILMTKSASVAIHKHIWQRPAYTEA
jgi:hypothetical protein